MCTRRVDESGTAKRVRRIGEWRSAAGTSEEQEAEGEGRPASEEETEATAVFFGRWLLFMRKISEGCGNGLDTDIIAISFLTNCMGIEALLK